MAHVLVAGLGDLGQGVARALLQQGHQVSGIRRRNEAPVGVDLYAQDLTEDTILLPPDPVELLYIIMTPSSRDEAGYENAYLRAPLRLLEALGQQQPLPPTLFVSSTAVFGDGEGEMSESTPPKPSAFNGRVMLAAEEELSLRTMLCAVRFSGIYGPGRLRLLRQVEAIASGTTAPTPVWTNRIHRDDCVGMLTHLGERFLQREMLPAVVIGTDNAPVSNLEVLQWIGQEQGLDLALDLSAPIKGKRLVSEFLQSGEYALRYPDYREGYRQVMAEAQRAAPGN